MQTPQEELDALRVTIATLRDEVLRLTAERDNRAKEFSREMEDVRQGVEQQFLAAMQEIALVFDQAVDTLSPEQRTQPNGQGVLAVKAIFDAKLSETR